MNIRCISAGTPKFQLKYLNFNTEANGPGGNGGGARKNVG